MTHFGTKTVSGMQKDERIEARKPVKHSAILHYKGTQIPVVVQDLSHSGARIAFHAGRAGMVIDGPFVIEVPGAMRLPAVPRWQKNSVFGAAFDLPPARKATYQQQIDRVISRFRR